MNAEQAKKNTKVLQRAMGIKGEVKPGQLKSRAQDIMQPKKKVTKLPALKTKLGVATRGLI